MRLREVLLHTILRTALLFAFGTAYGLMVTHLHDNQNLVPIKVGGVDRYSWRYLTFWGIAGVVLGSLLPWVDVVWRNVLGSPHSGASVIILNERPKTEDIDNERNEKTGSSLESGLGADWNPVVRSIGAFIGIAFAIV